MIQILFTYYSNIIYYKIWNLYRNIYKLYDAILDFHSIFHLKDGNIIPHQIQVIFYLKNFMYNYYNISLFVI